MKLTPGIGDRVRYFDESRDMQITLNGRAKVEDGAQTSYYKGARGGGCQADRPARATIDYDLTNSQDLLRQMFGLESSLINILAHEFGHLDWMHESAWENNNYIYDQDASDVRSIGWEDMTRSGQYRRNHQPR